jgi:hypothetical protein
MRSTSIASAGEIQARRLPVPQGVQVLPLQAHFDDRGRFTEIYRMRMGWGNPDDDVSALWILAPHDLAIVLHLVGSLPRLRTVQPLTARNPSLGLTAFLAEDGCHPWR